MDSVAKLYNLDVVSRVNEEDLTRYWVPGYGILPWNRVTTSECLSNAQPVAVDGEKLHIRIVAGKTLTPSGAIYD